MTCTCKATLDSIRLRGIRSLSQRIVGEMWADESHQDLAQSVNQRPHLTEQFSGFWFICWVSGCQCRHVGHHSRVIVTSDDTWRISGPCHAVTSESHRGVAAQYWRRHPAYPGLAAPNLPPCGPGAGASCTDSRRSLGQRRERGSPAWSWDQAGAAA